VILSDKDIKERIQRCDIVVTSADNAHLANIGPSSMDLRLGRYFKVYKKEKTGVLDPKDPETMRDVTDMIDIEDGKPYIVQPGEFILGVTMEKIKLSDDMVARVEGRSSLGRLGIIIHSTAGFVDAGFEGTITLEITNINSMPVALYPGMRVCQLAFEQMTSPADVSYSKKKSSKYHGQELPEESKIAVDTEFVN
jgi:dCTP deaminase